MHEVKRTLREVIAIHGKNLIEEVMFIQDNLDYMEDSQKVNMIFHNCIAQGIKDITVEKVQSALRHYKDRKRV